MPENHHVIFVSNYKRWDFGTINNPLLKKAMLNTIDVMKMVQIMKATGTS